ncbi:MAG: hypothetical protein V8Q84_11990 [Bilophila sp.]
MADFRSALASGRILVLDGGMGTMLQARGLPRREHPEQFLLDRPDVLRASMPTTSPPERTSS